MKKKIKTGNIRYSKIASTPLATFIKKRSKTLDVHSEQAQNINKLSKFGGLIILDAHQNALDIFASAASLTKHANFKNVVFPITAYDFYFPPVRIFLEEIRQDKFMNIMPVFRKEEKLDHKWNKIKRRYFPKDENSSSLNNHFVKQAHHALITPRGVVLISPYGGVKPLGSKVKRGVSDLLKTGAPAVCTWTKFNWKSLKYETSLSNPIYFNNNSSETYIGQTITSKFREIHQLN